jgi:hypothetical protein
MGRRANQVWAGRRARMRKARTVEERLRLTRLFGRHKKFRTT